MVIVLPSSPAIVTRNTKGGAYLHLNAVTGDWEGPHLFDPRATYSVSSVATTLADQDSGVVGDQGIKAGDVRNTLLTATIPSGFDSDGGHFILDFGLSTEEGPIRYLKIPNDNTLVIDPSYVFQKDHAVGTDLRYLRSVSPPTVSLDGTDFATHITGLAQARLALQDLIRGLIAAGVIIRFVVLLPEYRFSNPSLDTNSAV